MSRADTACIFDIQRFSVHDGPGIRTVVFFKGCPLDCVWCHNPEAIAPSPQIAYQRDRCVPGCRACVGACPEHALADDVSGRVNWERCTHCGLCVDPCPAGAIERVGRDVTPQELLAEVLRDRPFYESSGGGITLSGGEPALHSTFLQHFLPMARAESLHVVLETCGAVPWRLLEPLLPLVDHVLYDFKIAGAERHRAHTGSDNARIVENLSCLLERSASGRPAVDVRMPVVPGYNTRDDDVAEACAMLLGLGVRRLSLLPYNQLWEAKLDSLGNARRALGVRPPAASFYERLTQTFALHGILSSAANAPFV